MNTHYPFRVLLPIAQTVLAAVFGGIGLWQRATILSKPLWGNQTLWDSTARFHVWPWPYKFAAVANLPALLVGGVLIWPLDDLMRPLPEWVQASPLLIPTAVLWYLVGRRLEKRIPPGGHSRTHALFTSSTFICLSLIGAIAPLGYVGYLYYGGLLWVAVAVFLFRTPKHTAQAAS